MMGRGKDLCRPGGCGTMQEKHRWFVYSIKRGGSCGRKPPPLLFYSKEDLYESLDCIGSGHNQFPGGGV